MYLEKSKVIYQLISNDGMKNRKYFHFSIMKYLVAICSYDTQALRNEMI